MRIQSLPTLPITSKCRYVLKRRDVKNEWPWNSNNDCLRQLAGQFERSYQPEETWETCSLVDKNNELHDLTSVVSLQGSLQIYSVSLLPYLNLKYR